MHWWSLHGKLHGFSKGILPQCDNPLLDSSCRQCDSWAGPSRITTMWHNWEIQLHDEGAAVGQGMCQGMCQVMRGRVVQNYDFAQHHRAIPKSKRMRYCNFLLTFADSVLSLQKGKIWAAYIIPGYQSFTESLYKEADVYDFNTVVASVGGSLGLFLGFSCYEHGKKLIDLVGTARP